MILEFDRHFFLLLNSLAGKASWSDFSIRFLASNYAILIGGIIVLIWYWRVSIARYSKTNKEFIYLLFNILIAAVLSRLIITEGVRFFINRSRPFEIIASTNQIIAHAAGHSFPSGHAAFAFAIAASLSYHIPQVRLFLLSIAVLNSLARIAGGVHWPSDMMVGAVIGMLSGWIAERTIISLQRIKKPLEN